MMKSLTTYLVFLSLVLHCDAFTPSSKPTSTSTEKNNSYSSRQDFVKTLLIGTTTGIVSNTVLFPAQPSYARGRATLEYALDRYYPRIEAGGAYYANDLKRAIEKNDWKTIKVATSEPPKRTKEDKAKIDGGIAERAAQAGGFSNSRVVAAAELWAASFSDNSISSKTKKMKEQTEILKEVVDGMNYAAKLALGEEKQGGGLFGIGAKAPSELELAQQVRELYVKGGNAWNQYVFIANDELPVTLRRLPYL